MIPEPTSNDIKQTLALLTHEVCGDLKNWLCAQKDLMVTELPADPDQWPSFSQQPTSQDPLPKAPPRPQIPEAPKPQSPQIQKEIEPVGKQDNLLASFHAMQHARNKKQIETLEEREKALEALKTRACACKLCPLGFKRKDIMWSTGPADASLMFIAAGGNPAEPECGRIMTGDAADLLDKITAATAELNSEASAMRIYTSNIIKCACIPPKQSVSEFARTCLPYLRKEIQIVSPKVIVVWGTLAYQTLFGRNDPISQVRGTWQSFEGIPTIATHHPLEMISNPRLKGRVWKDLQLAVSRLKIL